MASSTREHVNPFSTMPRVGNYEALLVLTLMGSTYCSKQCSGNCRTNAPCPLLELFAGQFDPQSAHSRDLGLQESASARVRSIKYARDGDLDTATSLTQYALWQEPGAPSNWNNYGLIARDRAVELEQSQPAAARRLLRESLAAFGLALMVRDSELDEGDTAGARRYTAHLFEEMFPGVCPAKRCKHNQLLDEASWQLRQGLQPS